MFFVVRFLLVFIISFFHDQSIL